MRRMHAYVRFVAILLGACALLTVLAPAARAADQVNTYSVAAIINADGSLSVKATITFDGASPASMNQTFDTVTRTAEDLEYRFVVSDVVALSGGTNLNAAVTSAATSTTVTIPTANLTDPVELSYLVKGAALRGPQGETIVSWPLLQGLSLPVATFDATVGVPALFSMVDCAAGVAGSPGTCAYYGGGTHDAPNPFFHDESRAPGEVVIAIVRFPEGAVAVNQDVREVWTLDRAFSADPLPLGIALGLLVLGGLGLWAAHRRIGRDTAGAATPTLVAEFRPVGAGESEFRVLDGIRPGEVGTLVDERVDPVDVTATLLDLAVRGHLRINELPRESPHAATEWTFVRRTSDDKLLEYERTLLDAVAPIQGEPVHVTHLAGSVGAVIGEVQSQLYDEVVARGWFSSRPDATRNRWAMMGWIGLAAAVVLLILLAAFTSFGLTGLAMIVLALGVLFVAQEMPARTAAGTGILQGLDILRGSLLTHPVETVPTAGYTQLSAILPYSVVLGGKERWLSAVAASDDDEVADSADLDWYHGPDDWQLADLPASLANFITTVQGTLFSR